MARACSLCGVASGTVKEAGALCCVCSSIGDATDLRVIVARAVWSIARDKAGKAIKADEQPAATTYIADEEKRLLGKHDNTSPLPADLLEALCHSLALVRHHELTKAGMEPVGPASYESTECAAVRKMEAAGLKPSQMVAALKWACADEFWQTQTLSFNVLATHAKTWCRNPPRAKKAADRMPVLRAELTALLSLMRDHGTATAFAAESIDEAAQGARFPDALEEIVRRARTACADAGL